MVTTWTGTHTRKVSTCSPVFRMVRYVQEIVKVNVGGRHREYTFYCH